MRLSAMGNEVTQTRGGRKSKRMFGGKVTWIPKLSKNYIEYPTKDPKTGWTAKTKRCGVIAKKMGMTTDWNEWGIKFPLTYMQVLDCQVVEHKKKPIDNVTGMLIGAGDVTSVKKVPKSLQGLFAKADVNPKSKLIYFRISEDAYIPVVTKLHARHFVPGQLVDIQGITKGKGFQGAMKRWGFKGQPASHGVSLAHRSLGATGARQDPGKTWKGKKMAGRMGGDRTTIPCLKVYDIWPELNLISIVGSVPGPTGGWLRIRDGLANKFSQPPPFPTYIPQPEVQEPERIKAVFKNPWGRFQILPPHKKIRKLTPGQIPWTSEEIEDWTFDQQKAKEEQDLMELVIDLRKEKKSESEIEKIKDEVIQPGTIMDAERRRETQLLKDSKLLIKRSKND